MSIDALLREYIPHAPNIGLFVVPDIPRAKLSAAVGDYANSVEASQILALYDATRLGSGKDGALFLEDRIVFQNNNLEKPRTVRYDDIVRVDARRQLLGGRKVEIDINQGRATVTESIDFSGRPDAAEYVERFLREAMLTNLTKGESARTNVDRVRSALEQLVREGQLTEDDRSRILAVLPNE